MNEQQIFHNFSYAVDFLERAQIIRFTEYDENGHPYNQIKNCISAISKEKDKKGEMQKVIHIINPIKNKLEITLYPEKSFSHLLLEKDGEDLRLILFFHTGYKYIIVFRKI